MSEADILLRIAKLEQMIVDEKAANAERLQRMLTACSETIKISTARLEAVRAEAMKAADMVQEELAALRELRRPNIEHRN